MKERFLKISFLIAFCFLFLRVPGYAEQATREDEPLPSSEEKEVITEVSSAAEEPVRETAPAQETKTAISANDKTAAAAEESAVTLDFKDADIQNVLRVLAYKSGVNIVASKEVVGTVTIRLVDVPWEQALSVILSTYGFAYEREGNIITVSTMETLKLRRENQRQLADIEGVTSRVFNLKYIDASDAKKMLEAQLSPQGKISVMEVTGQKGWEFGVPTAGGSTTEAGGKAERERRAARSRSLVITDTPTYLDRIEKILKDMDVKPNQILIEARIMEVSRDALKDLGIEFSTGQRLETHGVDRTAGRVNVGDAHHEGTITGRVYSETDSNQLYTFTPANFVPRATGLTPYNAGLEFLFRRLVGREVEIMVHALEEDIRTNTLSAPRVLTLSGQEAEIMVGEKYPIIETNVSGTSGTTTTTLAYYQDIGIQLYVVPQISGEEQYINMIIHPVISSFTQTVSANNYPRLVTREAETQVLMYDGETIVIGGLLKDVKSQGKIGIPILSDIPIIGSIFTRRTNDIEKIDLLIFITARIVRPGELTEREMAMVKKALDSGEPDIAVETNKPAATKKKEDKNKKEEIKAEGYSNDGNKGYFKKR